MTTNRFTNMPCPPGVDIKEHQAAVQRSAYVAQELMERNDKAFERRKNMGFTHPLQPAAKYTDDQGNVMYHELFTERRLVFPAHELCMSCGTCIRCLGPDKWLREERRPYVISPR